MANKKNNLCPVCNGINSPHPEHEPDSKLGMSWWKKAGFNGPNRCAVQIAALRAGLIPDLATEYMEPETPGSD